MSFVQEIDLHYLIPCGRSNVYIVMYMCVGKCSRPPAKNSAQCTGVHGKFTQCSGTKQNDFERSLLQLLSF